jgi:hypothetical protein
MPKPRPLPPPFAAGPFATADARAIGISTGRLRASDLRSPLRGVRVPSSAGDSLLDGLTAYRAHMAEDEYFSHVTAARLYGIPLPRDLADSPAVHVSVAAPSHPPQVRGVVGHRLFVPIAPRIHRGLSVVAPGRTWTQLAATLRHGDLIVAGDYLVRRKRPLCTLAELAGAVASMGRARGVRAARLALAEIREGTDSPMETRLRLLIVWAGLPEPVIGHTVRNREGDFVATPDLCYVRERIAIEYEGSIHQSDARVFAEDIERRELLEEAGWLVIRVIKGHVFGNPHWLAERVRRALRERADLPPAR